MLCATAVDKLKGLEKQRVVNNFGRLHRGPFRDGLESRESLLVPLADHDVVYGAVALAQTDQLVL